MKIRCTSVKCINILQYLESVTQWYWGTVCALIFVCRNTFAIFLGDLSHIGISVFRVRITFFLQVVVTVEPQLLLEAGIS